MEKKLPGNCVNDWRDIFERLCERGEIGGFSRDRIAPTMRLKGVVRTLRGVTVIRLSTNRVGVGASGQGIRKVSSVGCVRRNRKLIGITGRSVAS